MTSDEIKATSNALFEDDELFENAWEDPQQADDEIVFEEYQKRQKAWWEHASSLSQESPIHHPPKFC